MFVSEEFCWYLAVN